MSKGYLLDALADRRLLSLAKVALLFLIVQDIHQKKWDLHPNKGFVGNWLNGQKTTKPTEKNSLVS